MTEFRSEGAVPDGMKLPKFTDAVFPVSGVVNIRQSEAQALVATVDGLDIKCADGSDPGVMSGDGVWSTYRVSGAGSSIYVSHVPSGNTLRTANATGLTRVTVQFGYDGVRGGVIESFINGTPGHLGGYVVSKN